MDEREEGEEEGREGERGWGKEEWILSIPLLISLLNIIALYNLSPFYIDLRIKYCLVIVILGIFC